MVDKKRVQRLCREEKLTVRRKGGRNRAIGKRAPLDVPQRPNERQSFDFVSDQVLDGRRFRILAVVDDGMPDCLAIAWRGKPAGSGSVNGGRAYVNAIMAWADRSGVLWDCIAPAGRGKTASIESFNDRMRDEMLFETLSRSLVHVRVVPADWRSSTTSSAHTFEAWLDEALNPRHHDLRPSWPDRSST